MVQDYSSLISFSNDDLAHERFETWPVPGEAYFIRRLEDRDAEQEWYLPNTYGMFDTTGELLDLAVAPINLREMAADRYQNMWEIPLH